MTAKIEFTRDQITDIRYALALAAVDAISNECPISAKIFEDLRQYIIKQSEYLYTDTDSVITSEPRERLYCKNCLHCKSDIDGTYCILRNRAVSLNAHAEECGSYKKIQNECE